MPGRYQNVQRFQYAFGKPRKGVLGRPGLGRAWAAVEALTKPLFENLPPMFRRRGPPLTPFSCLPPEQRKNKRVPLYKIKRDPHKTKYDKERKSTIFQEAK